MVPWVDGREWRQLAPGKEIKRRGWVDVMADFLQIEGQSHQHQAIVTQQCHRLGRMKLVSAQQFAESRESHPHDDNAAKPAIVGRDPTADRDSDAVF